MVEVLIWFLLYVLLIMVLSSWRAHLDVRGKKHRRVKLAGPVPCGHRRLTLISVRGALKRSHRTV